MSRLADVIPSDPPLRWIVGTVKKILSDGSVTLAYNANDPSADETDTTGEIPGVACLDQYTPVVGDVVHALSFEDRGVLILGSGNSHGLVSPPLTTPAEVIVSSIGGATWVEATQSWEPGVVRQEPGVIGCWFFDPAAFVPLQTTELEAFALEITRTSGDRAQLLQHINFDTTTPLAIVEGPRYQNQRPEVGVPTWIDMPIGWGVDLIVGIIKGIGVTSDDTVSTYSTTARVRLQPLSIVA